MSRLKFVFVILVASSIFLAGCQTQLYGDLSEQEANAILAVLLEAFIPAEKRAGAENTYTVFVEEGEFARAMRLLEARSLPNRQYDDLGKVFGKEALFSTPVEEKARYLYAMQEELAQTVGTISGVLQARVHLVLPEQDHLGRELYTPSAAVFVNHVDDERHDSVRHRLEIRRLVSAAVPNLDEEQIVVSFFPVPMLEENVGVTTPWINVLGIRVAANSAQAAWWAVAGMASFCSLLLVVTGISVWRRNKR